MLSSLTPDDPIESHNILATRLVAPRTRDELQRWIHTHTGISMPKTTLCPAHHNPLDYLERSFFEKPGDIVVWACRGGGKTMLGAVATLLDLLFKPGIQVRILGGSLEQSNRMYTHLRNLLESRFNDLLEKPPTRRRIQLRNGSVVEILAQSERSVRGTRVQKLRCDEVELFGPDVWRAAQLTTRSIKTGNNRLFRGSIEALSTMHKTHGNMQKLLADPGSRTAVFKWCIWDVIAQCEKDRPCDTCSLFNDCQGRARHATGFVPVADVLEMHRRVSRPVWECEMLCLRPATQGSVFTAFSRETHVRPWPMQRQARPAEPILIAGQPWCAEPLIAGVDFGFRGAFVCLWIQPLRDPLGRPAYWVLDELIARERTLTANAATMKKSGPSSDPWKPKIVYCDVAGRSANSQTGHADESVLRKHGFKVRSSSMKIETGIARINELVDPALAASAPTAASPRTPLLLIDPRCRRLVDAMECLRRLPSGVIEKDNQSDHPIDALRYALVNHEHTDYKIESRPY
jgi:hypothetical protein